MKTDRIPISSFVACAMAEGLKKFVKEKKIIPDKIPLSSRNIQLFQELEKFFEILYQINESKISERFYQGSFGDNDDE